MKRSQQDSTNRVCLCKRSVPFQVLLVEFGSALSVTGVPGWAFIASPSTALFRGCTAFLEGWLALGGLPRQLLKWRGRLPRARHHQLLRVQRAVPACPGAPESLPCAALRRQRCAPRSCCSQEYNCILTCHATAAVSCAAPGRGPPCLCHMSWLLRSSGRNSKHACIVQVRQVYAVEAHIPCRGSCGRAEAAGAMQVHCLRFLVAAACVPATGIRMCAGRPSVLHRATPLLPIPRRASGVCSREQRWMSMLQLTGV